MLGRYPSATAAADAAHTTHAAVYAWVTTLDGVVLRYRHGRRPKAPPAVWPRLQLVRDPLGCPVVAALRHPRTFDEVAAVLPDWTRERIARRLFALYEEGTACKIGGVWSLTDPTDDAEGVA